MSVLPAVLTLSQICPIIHGSLLPKFSILYLTLLSFISLGITLHSYSFLLFLFTQVGVILKPGIHELCSIISAIKHNFETANDSDPWTTTLQCPWRVTENLWWILVKRTSSRCHTPTFNDCICRILAYCSYNNLTKTRMNHNNPLKSQGWLLCQRKEVGWFSGMHYLQDCAGWFYSILSSRSMLSVDRRWTDGYVMSWVQFFLLFKGKSVVSLFQSSSSDGLHTSLFLFFPIPLSPPQMKASNSVIGVNSFYAKKAHHISAFLHN